MKIRKLLAGAALAAMLMPANRALASAVIDPLVPSAQYSSGQSSGGGANTTQNTTGSFSESYSNSYDGETATATAYTSTTMSPNPVITAEVTQNSSGPSVGQGLSPSAYANYYYSAIIVGPTNDNVPVDLSYTETVTLTGPQAIGNAIAQGSLGIFATTPLAFYDIPPIASYADIGAAYFLGTQSVSGSISYLATANTSFVIGGAVSANLFTYTGSATDTLDPVLTIDPSFASVDPNYLKDYSIELSSGVGNAVSAAPEPATWAMMFLGIGGIGAAMRMEYGDRLSRPRSMLTATRLGRRPEAQLSALGRAWRADA
jgi:hypothetical protein